MKASKERYLELRNQGYGFNEIAKICGVSRQAVYASVNDYHRRPKRGKRNKPYITGIENQVIYVNIADYLIDNDLSVSALACKCGVYPYTMLKAMRGEMELRKSSIDALIKVTGLTYENLFKEDFA